MAKKYYRASRRTSSKHGESHGKVFKTKKGRVGCYVYKYGKRVGFISKRK